MKVTAVVSPALFYLVLPFGARAAQLVNADCESPTAAEGVDGRAARLGDELKG